MNFRDYMALIEYVNNVGAAVTLPADTSNSMSLDGSSPEQPKNLLSLPAVTRSGRIDTILKNQNPIYVRLSDGSELYFTHDEYRKRIKGNPEVGRTMTVVFQRHPNDGSKVPSKIDAAQVS